jgi:hypothetical protein
VEVVASLTQGRTAAAQCGLFTHKSVRVIFERPVISEHTYDSKGQIKYITAFMLNPLRYKYLYYCESSCVC